MKEEVVFEIDNFVSVTDSGAIPVRLVIVRDSSGFFLISTSEAGGALLNGDTWHASLTEAFAQANFQFGVVPGRWRSVAT